MMYLLLLLLLLLNLLLLDRYGVHIGIIRIAVRAAALLSAPLLLGVIHLVDVLVCLNEIHAELA